VERANGITGTMMPYRKMSEKMAMQIVVRMKAFDERV
jgi:hypothetical protein